MSCRSSTEFKKEATQGLSFYLKKPHQATEAMHWMNLPQLSSAVGGAGVRVRARGGHLERSDLTDAGGLRTRWRAVGRETILQQSKIDSRASFPRLLEQAFATPYN